MDKVASVLKILARAYLLGSCWRCADILSKLSSGPDAETALVLLREAYSLAKAIASNKQKHEGVECCIAARLRPGLEPEVCSIYGGMPAGELCCVACPDVPQEEEYLEAAREVLEGGLLVRAVSLAQA